MMRSYFQLDVPGRTADLDIYGDITSWTWRESDVSSYTLSRLLADLGPEVQQINVNINSYGGEVGEGLAIYNALKRHPAKVVTRVDGFACSIASVIFMAGDERHMVDTSLLMVHNAWTYGSGDARELRKLADDMDTINQASKAAYLSRVSISEEDLSALMDAETWITSEDALSWGFATGEAVSGDPSLPSQCARKAAFQAICMASEDDRGADDGEEEHDADEDDPSTDASDGSDDESEQEDADEASDDKDEEGEGDDPDDEAGSEDEDDPDEDAKSKQRTALAAFFNELTI